jgi:hypothetical protein
VPGSSGRREKETGTSLGWVPPTLICSHKRGAASYLRIQDGSAYG